MGSLKPWPRDDANVLVTGATGLLGSRLVHALLERNASVTCLIRNHDPASALSCSGDIEHVSVVSGRLERFEEVKAAIVEREIDTIFHLGAQAIVEVAQRDPLGTFESNIRGTYHVLEVCRLHSDQVRRIVIASSDKAYGECGDLPYTEETPLAAKNPYDVSKSCADLIAQTYACTFNLPIAIARCGNLFGPGDLNWNRLVPGTARSLLHGERPVIRSDGTLVRDYLFVDDAVLGFLSLAQWIDDRDGSGTCLSTGHCAFNFGTGQPIDALSMTRKIQVAVGREDLEPVILNQAYGEIMTQYLDASRARRELNWVPRHDLDVALVKTIGWYRKHLCQPPVLIDPEIEVPVRSPAISS